MLDAASSRRRRRSLFLWGVIVVSAAIAVVLGVVGYAEYHSTALDGVGDRSFLGLLYDSVRRCTRTGARDLASRLVSR